MYSKTELTEKTMERKVSIEQFKENMALTLIQKEFHFNEVLDVFYHKLNGNVHLMFSAGKGSVVMSFLADKWCGLHGYPLIQKVFLNTTNEHKQILDFARTFDIIEIRPKMTFAQTLIKYGFPFISKEQSMAISRYQNTKREDQKVYRLTGLMKDGRKGVVGVIRKKWRKFIDAPFKITNRCCDILKKEPIKRYEKETKSRPIIGVQATESIIRRVDYIKRGCNVLDEGKEMCRPLSIFTDEDLWALIKKYDIKICEIYYDQIIDGQLVTGERQTGCAWCGFGAHMEDQENNRFIRNGIREPKRYDTMMDKMGYRDALGFYGIKLTK